ncbi:TauD/TfdA family dioxygenase [Streptomyces sp. NPDC050388]|uniref:TauD/TfdA family dioxygenase n=1 Tax=Streptomyces sp. NPDC050388 TaxID=3155781 RepID=UPI00342DDE16
MTINLGVRSGLAAPIPEFRILQEDRKDLLRHLAALREDHGQADERAYLASLRYLSDVLPRELRAELQRLCTGDSCGSLVVRGMSFDDAPPTPVHWSERDHDATTLQDFWLTLLAGQLGELFCWSSLQDGRLLNDIVPVRGHEQAQTGAGSTAPLEFHVEDAFHDDRCDLLALLAIRNPDRIPTMLASIDDIDTNGLDLDVLCEPRFLIKADPEHLRGLDATSEVNCVRPVVTREGTLLRLRVDPAYTTALPGDGRAARAFSDVCARLEAKIRPVALDAGDILFFDNHRFVHGRAPFQPRYDGTDRWLRKAVVLRDPARTQARRVGSDGFRFAVPALDGRPNGPSKGERCLQTSTSER